MGLKGDPLLILSTLATVAAVALLAALWHRGGRARLPLRTAGILLCQALAVFSVALEVNRAGDFYPSWAALTQDTGARSARAEAPATGPARAVTVRHGGPLAAWAPAGSARWHLAEAPRLLLPTEVPAGRRLPMLVVLLPPAGAPGGLRDAALPALVRPAGTATAVLVLRPAGAAAVAALATALPRVLPHVLPVGTHGWALVGAGDAAPLAVDLDARDAVRYGPVALVADGGEPSARTLTRLAAATAGTGALAVLPARPPVTPGRAVTVEADATPGARLADALAWARSQLPAALAPAQVVWSGGFAPPGH